MSRILTGILDDHTIVQEGIRALLKDVPDIEVVVVSQQYEKLLEDLKTASLHILIINLHNTALSSFKLISDICHLCPGVRILVLSVLNSEEAILKSIKAGAKGFLARDTGRNELMEAIYSLRNGFDYFSKSITHLLLNRYIADLKLVDDKSAIKELSSREIEILRLWGKSLSNKEIADSLFLSVRTVETHKNHIMQKLSLKTSVDMIKYGIRNNIIEI
jgi:two-component system response regulator NreC